MVWEDGEGGSGVGKGLQIRGILHDTGFGFPECVHLEECFECVTLCIFLNACYTLARS